MVLEGYCNHRQVRIGIEFWIATCLLLEFDAIKDHDCGVNVLETAQLGLLQIVVTVVIGVPWLLPGVVNEEDFFWVLGSVPCLWTFEEVLIICIVAFLQNLKHCLDILLGALVDYRYNPGFLLIKFVDVIWTCLDEGDAHCAACVTGTVGDGVLIEHEVDGGQIVTVDVPSNCWSAIIKQIISLH